ncbi:DNA-binding transcriptional response regulator, NtrC family, contains REC, AAA-type ATPase, and a Fis-type DNA-binding domains [Luteibacter sp. UNCMF331Sha3.1]|uniref:sigma-54-dependent transcriptional regulator n=1 Tax=Luteibacter sp. UNCMF331Sha3.1 TaxID=1502760 RepID=UPI0008BFF109|nr:sigma-54 dependent transcriptional regulator [Luteibacter sp. UNCMF331Sha3.1]SEM51399.1 DNA-binding transcriptional response regulator, NtrC family, contains REC, AAA-type ATPase, and a Fis-type DNA-binding domains [Luteibacter sp. UNCMF331Sha3.1]
MLYEESLVTLPVLVVDDQPDVRLALRILLRSEGMATEDVDSPAAALEAVAHREFACALVDLNYAVDTTSGHEGLELVTRLRQEAPDLPLIAMTGWGSIDVAVRAMQLGAADFVEKPWNNTRLIQAIRGQAALHAMSEENRRLRAETALGRTGINMLRTSESSSMKRVVELIERVAVGDSHVLIIGENGTGKSLLAREIHARSTRAERPVIRVDMSSLPESRFEDEMFGEYRPVSRPGRFELADGGSLILDEIGSIHPSQQAKLLRVIAEGELERGGTMRTRRVDVRVISTTNMDLDSAVRGERFRRDLLYRLNAVQVRLPALRERVEDIVPLARHFLVHECKRRGRNAMTLAPSAERALRGYDWPGNVRELEHAIERSVLLATRDTIDADVLALDRPAAPPLLLDTLTLPDAEDLLIRQALERHGRNLQRAADDLGISRQALYRRLEKQRARHECEATGLG